MVGKTKEQIKELFKLESYEVSFIESTLSLIVMGDEGSVQYIFSNNGKCIAEKSLR